MPKPDLGRRWLPSAGIAALVALTILDIVLIRLAFDHVDGPENLSGQAVPAASNSPAPSGSDSSAPPEDAPTTPLPAGPVRLALAPDGTVLRAVTGDCAEGAEPQVALARPGADRFRTLQVGPRLAEVLDVRTDSRDELVVVGADRGCEVVAFEGGDGRGPWSANPAEDQWYLDTTADEPFVHAPGGAVELPCLPVALSTLDAVRVLCDGGTLVGTGDGGESWATLGRLENASAMAFQGPGRGIALARTDDCPVAVQATSNGGAGWDTLACLEGENGRAVALRDEMVVAVVDETLWRSADGGTTWRRPTG